MKLDARQVETFLRNPAGVRCVLLYGEDEGLVRERASELTKSTAGSVDDPFRVTDLGRDGYANIEFELGASSLVGGRRVVRVRDATDSMTPFLQKALSASGEALLVIEAGSLSGRSTLRSLVERRQGDAVSIACYHEDARSLERTIRDFFAEFDIKVDTETVAWLTAQLGNDRGTTRQELSKIALYVGNKGIADFTTVRDMVGDSSELQLEDALFFATEGDVAGADRALSLAIAGGSAPVSILRAALMHMHRLQRARALHDGGATPIDAVRATRPPVFSGRLRSLVVAVRLWTCPAISNACDFIYDLETQSKRTGSPAELLCQRSVTVLARSSRSKIEQTLKSR